MPYKVYTTETRFSMPIGSEIRTYCDKFVTEYNKVYRDMWHTMTALDFKKQYPKDSNYITYICNKYGLLKRTVNSIKFEIKGRMKSYMELKKTQLKQLEIKICVKEDKIDGIIKKIETLKPLVRENKASQKQLIKYRNLKQSLYYQKNKLNKIKQQYKKLAKQIRSKVYSLGFGSKNVFRKQYFLSENGYKTKEKWHNDYIKARDKNIFYLGSLDETCKNQMFQMVYLKDTDDFSLKIRKEYKYCIKEMPESNYITVCHVKFNHLHEELVKICQSCKNDSQSSPLSFRFHRRNTHWYLQVIFRIQAEEYETTSKYGTIGLDYNDGFIELCQTDECGNMAEQKHYELKYHGMGNKAKSEIEETVSQIVNYAKRKGKDVIIEDLSFKKKKSKTDKHDKNKKYNAMIHLFDYSRYKSTMENTCHRNKVVLTMINPYMTSQIGKQKYCETKKLNVHQAASYVIARKGQGFEDKYIKYEKQKKA